MINFANEPTIKDYLKSIRRHWWIPTAAILAALVVGFWQAFLVPPTYKATALVLADTSTTDTKDYVDKITVPEVARVMETLGAQVLSIEKLEAIVREMDLYPEERAALGPEKAARKLKKAIHTEVTGFDTFAVSVVYGDPQTAARVANRVAKDFIDAQVGDRKKNGTATQTLLNDQIARAASSLKKQDETMKAFRIAHMGALPGQTEGNIRAIERWQTDLRVNTEALVRARERLSLSLASTPKIFQGETIETMKAEVSALEAERKGIQSQIAAEEKLVSKAGMVEGQLAILQTQYNSELATYNDLLKQRQAAAIRVGLDLDRLESLFKVLEPARTPSEAFRPMKPLVMSLALLAGLLLGILGAIGRDYFDETFDEAVQLGKHTGLPVFAAIPRARGLNALPPRAGALHS